MIPLPWAEIPFGSTVLAPDGMPDVVTGLIPPYFVRLARSGFWGLVGHPIGVMVVRAAPPPADREDPETAAMRLIVERFPATEVIDE